MDFRFLETNPAFEKQTGLRDAVGKRVRELLPQLEAHWFETYGRVALTGESIRFVDEARALDGRWFDVYAFRLGAPELSPGRDSVHRHLRAQASRGKDAGTGELAGRA